MKKITYLILLLFTYNLGFGQILTFDFNGLDGNEVSANSNSNDPNLGASTITRGVGLTAGLKGDRFNAVNWGSGSIANAVTGNDYMEFTITPNIGYRFGITNIVINFQRSGAGPRGIALRSSLDGYTANIDSEKAVADITSTTEIFIFTVNQIASANPIVYRIYGWAASGAGTGGFEGSGNDIIVNGSVAAIPTCAGITTTWDGSVWSNGTGPDLTIEARLNASYNTFTDGGSFSACSLTVANNSDLFIADNTFIEVQNDITVDAGGAITVQPTGAFVQNNDLGRVINNGTITVTKETSDLNVWYEYTYWSSPVSRETIDQGLFESDAGRRYMFNAQNFLDATAETNNNNATDDAQDDIDDNSNDWQWVNGLTVMQPGVGYASTHSEAFFTGPPNSSPPYQFDYTFEGPFNNGVITVPVFRNDFEPDDNNWNLIGNPYPSAIDADLFLAANANVDSSITTPFTVDGAIFLWSQATGYSPTENGNQALNFSAADYAIINGTGETVGGDGTSPFVIASGIRAIPSGQAFFVSYSDGALPISTSVNGDGHTIAEGAVTFNNSMRVFGTNDNSVFFKNSNSKKNSSTIANKLWINLTSDNGVFNQTLIGYINGASNDDDGTYFDARKNLSTGTSAILYSKIEGSEKKFAIQGKDINSINEDELINLGFSTTIDVATIYTLSIAQIEGDFLTSNTVYLKDNLLGTLHNLSNSDYTFTSEVGEFNTRFEIVFNANALSTEDLALENNTLKIIELEDDRVQFTTSSNIKAVRIYDLLGRQLYNFKGQSNSETYKLSNLSSTIYIAKVELLNGATITKKAFKK